MKYFSMFSGIGGFELGIQKAEERSDDLRPLQQGSAEKPEERNSFKNKLQQWQCVGFSEIDKYAVQIYKQHFPNHKNFGDATKINADELPDFDLLCGGFPCQAFSIAGKRMGFKDTRGTLFYEIARIAKIKRPRFLFLENVKGLLNHAEGRTFATVLATLDELGYDAEWQVLNSKHFGVPQNRERVFIIGHLRGQSSQQIFPIGESGEGIDEGTSETTVHTLTAGGHSGGMHSSMTLLQLNSPKHSNNRLYDKEGISPSLNTAQGGNRQPKIAIPCPTPDRQSSKGVNEESEIQVAIKAKFQKTAYDTNGISPTVRDGHGDVVRVAIPVLTPDRQPKIKVPSATKCGYETAEEGDSIRISHIGSKTGRGRVGKKQSQALLSGGDMYALQNSQIRRLTPVECERLQGFPDGWTEGVSDTQRYKQLGNAVTVNVIEAITKELLEELKEK